MSNDVREQLRLQFEVIRDERRKNANTAERIGSAFLSLLSYIDFSDTSLSSNYLRKDQEDTTSFLVTFEGGIHFKDIYNIDASGNAILKSIKNGSFDNGKGEAGTFDLYVADDRSYLDIDNINIRESLNVKYLQIGNGVIKWDDENKAFYVEQIDGTPASFYATKGLSALGFNSLSDTGGGSFDLLQDWDKYVDETAKSMALSAYLGKDLLDRVASLESSQKGHKITISGAGNVVVDVGESSDGSTLTFTKGNIDLSGYATTTALAEVSNKADAVTAKVNDFLEGTDTDNIINRWKELEAFLAGQTQTSTLADLLAVKADKSVRINAGEGLTGGGSLSLDVTLSLATVGTEGTYTKVTVDKYGRVTGHASLTATDIPVLDISKINGLQGELDKKLNITDFGSKFAAEMANWFKKDTDGNVLVANAKGFYSESFVSALGKSSGGSSSGGSSFDLLQDWNKYDDSTAKNTALSAYLGKNLLDRMVLDFSDIDNCRVNGTGKSGVFDVYYNGHSVGTLLVSNDVLSHGTNQLFITNMLMDVDANSHQDDRIYVYYRYYNFMAPNAKTAKGTWSKWCLVIGSNAGENGIARIKGVKDNDIDGVQDAIGVWAIDGTAYSAASETDIINIFN